MILRINTLYSEHEETTWYSCRGIILHKKNASSFHAEVLYKFKVQLLLLYAINYY